MKDLGNYKLPFNPLGEMECVELLDFQDCPILSIEQSERGVVYLSYLVTYLSDNIEQRLAIQITELEKQRVYNSTSIRRTFLESHQANVFVYSSCDTDGTVSDVHLIPKHKCGFIDSIPENYSIVVPTKIKDDLSKETANLLAKSKDRNRVLYDLYLTGDSLNTGLKPWAFTRVLLPSLRIVREAFELDDKQFDQYVSIPELEVASLKVTIEIDHEIDLFQGNMEFERLNKIIKLLSANTKEDFKNVISLFKRDMFLKSFIDIVKVVNSKDLIMVSTVVNPATDVINQTIFDSERATKIKDIIDEQYDEITDIDEVVGVFVDVNYAIKEPSFAIRTDDEFSDIIKGKIDKNLQESLKVALINISTKKYRFKIKTVYKPETTLRKESTKRTLIEFSPIESK